MRALIDSTDPLRLKFQVWCSSIVLLHGMYVPVLRIISVQDQCFIGFMVPEIELFLPAGRTRSARPAGPKITLRFLRLLVCASALITYAIITSRTLLPCDLALVDFGNLDDCFV